MVTRLSLLTLALLPLAAGDAHGQMMGGGREARGSREAMAERLANASPEQRAWLESLRDERSGARAVVQRVTVRAGIRRYELGPAEVSESLSPVTYSMRRPRLRLRVTSGLLRFRSGDTLSIWGLAPLDARLDIAMGARDSLRLALRAPSAPASLSQAQVSALASVGTSTVDLSSIELGTPASISARYTRVLLLGAGGSLSATLGGDFEPRPSEAKSSYWGGSTLRTGVGLAGTAGTTRISGALDVTRSFSDSLGGQNLFQGGGTLLARANVAKLLGASGETLVDLSTFYFRPFSVTRTDAASRRVPVGDFMGASAIGVLPVGELFLTALVVGSHESSPVASGASGSGRSLGTSLAVDVPVAGRFTITPEVGYARGSVRTQMMAPTGGGPGGITDALSGWWVTTDFSLSF